MYLRYARTDDTHSLKSGREMVSMNNRNRSKHCTFRFQFGIKDLGLEYCGIWGLEDRERERKKKKRDRKRERKGNRERERQ